MSSPPAIASNYAGANRGSLGDSFAYGLLIMLVINLGQRIVGLLRNFGFCQFLSDAELGHWALANSFFIIAAPIAVLGLPGSFGKFVEFYRQRSCLRIYLTRVAVVSGTSTLIFATIIFAASDTFAWLVYGETATLRVVGWTAIALLAQVSYNFVVETSQSLRQIRIISLMQLAQGVSFTVLGIGWLTVSQDWVLLLPSYSTACLIGMMVGGWSVWRNCRHELTREGTIEHKELWPRILPFAAALWISNLLTNTFELSDRYMLLHFAPGGETVGQSLVGQYYCGRIIPNLLTSLGMMLCGMLLPYLSKDWEAGHKDAIERRMRQVLSLLSLTFTSLAVVALLASPLLFDWVFEGRYAGGKSILGISLLQCTWASICMVAGAYLLCAERVKAGNFNLFIGLVLNISLNVPFIYWFGLMGSVAATSVANFVVMLLTFRSMHRSGCNVGRTTYVLAMLPAILLLGPELAAAAITMLVFLAGRTDLILSRADRIELDGFILPKLARFNVRLESLWP